MSRVITADAIYKVSQYDFDMDKLAVYPKHVTLPNNKNESTGIIGLD